MVSIIRLTGAGHEEYSGLSAIQAKNTLKKLDYERYLLVNWQTQEVIDRKDLDLIFEENPNAQIALVPQVAGGSQSASPLFSKLSKQLQLGGCRRCWEEGNPRQYPIEELHAVGHQLLCDRHYHGA